MTFVWATVQMGMAILCSCMPTYGPLLPVLAKPFKWVFGSVTTRMGRSRNTTMNRYGKDSDGRPWIRVEGPQPNISANSWSHRNVSSEEEVQLQPMKGIQVNRTVEVA
jgi:hypothetical protein